jgi:hypothetical protein
MCSLQRLHKLRVGQDQVAPLRETLGDCPLIRLALYRRTHKLVLPACFAGTQLEFPKHRIVFLLQQVHLHAAGRAVTHVFGAASVYYCYTRPAKKQASKQAWHHLRRTDVEDEQVQ